MKDMTNQQLIEKYAMIAGQLALAESFHQPRNEKRFERELLKLEEEVLRRMQGNNLQD